MTVYGPRCNVHPDRYGANRPTNQLRLIVVHTSEGSEGTSSAENLCSYMTLPGDRLNPDGSRYGASYHYVTDTDRVLPATPDNVVAYSAAGANYDGIHICIPGKAAQTRAQWLEPVSRAYIGQLSDVIIDVADRFRIPLDRLGVPEIISGGAGYCGHADISAAYHRSTHTDPGVNFPWDVLADLVAPPEEPPMTVSYFKLAPDALTIWATSDNLIAVRLEESQANARGVIPSQVPVLPSGEAERYVYHSSGLPRASVR